MLNYITKATRAIWDGVFAKRDYTNPKLIMTLLIKNEEELLEKNLIFHKAMGVDSFIITDNNSTDSTPQIIKKYQKMGWIVESIEEHATNYQQKAWVDRMIRLAKDKYHADWVINADADEFWHTPSGDLKQEMRQRRVNTLLCKVVNFLPVEEVPFWRWDEVVTPVADKERYDLSKHSIYSKSMTKVAHSTVGYIRISMGNHKVTMLPSRKLSSEIKVFHYNIRSKAQFLEKMINGGKQFENNPKKSVARHWRYYYELHKQGLLEREYERMIGTDHLEEFRKCGIVYRDSSVAEVFRGLGY